MSDVKKFFTKGTLKKGTQPIVEQNGTSILIEVEFPSIYFDCNIRLRITGLNEFTLKEVIRILDESKDILVAFMYDGQIPKDENGKKDENGTNYGSGTSTNPWLGQIGNYRVHVEKVP